MVNYTMTNMSGNEVPSAQVPAEPIEEEDDEEDEIVSTSIIGKKKNEKAKWTPDEVRFP